MSRQMLIAVLFLGGVVQLTAVIPLFFAHRWMTWAHGMLGLGTLPQMPIIEYLTRTECLLYAMWGALHLFIVQDVDRYVPLIRMLAVLKFLFGISVICVDWYAGMPWFWTLSEGPSLLVYAIVLGWLAHQQLAKADRA